MLSGVANQNQRRLNMAKLSEPVAKALETLMECHNYDTRTVVHLIARATKYGNSDEVELLRCENFNDILSALVDGFASSDAINSTESPNVVAADNGLILTEEELSSIAKSLGTFMPGRVVKIIKSHQALLSANAELSFRNMKLQDEVNSSNHRRESAEMSKDYAWMLYKQIDKINAEYLAKIKALEELK
jgi:hypothetical protein